MGAAETVARKPGRPSAQMFPSVGYAVADTAMACRKRKFLAFRRNLPFEMQRRVESP